MSVRKEFRTVVKGVYIGVTLVKRGGVVMISSEVKSGTDDGVGEVPVERYEESEGRCLLDSYRHLSIRPRSTRIHRNFRCTPQT